MTTSSNASRQARQEKLQAAARTASRERRRKKIVGGSIAGVVVLALAGGVGYAVSQRPVEPTVTSAGDQLTPQAATAEGSFAIKQDGAVDATQGRAQKEAKPTGVHTLLLFDPQCPGCGSFERAMGPTLREEVSKGTINYYIAPISFLNSQSRDQYSLRAANAVVTVAEKAPTQILPFIEEIYAEENQPGEGPSYRAVSDETLASWAVNAGVPQEVANSFKHKNYSDWLLKSTEAWGGRTDLFPQGQLSTPALFMGGSLVEGKTTGAERVNLEPQAMVEDCLARLERYRASQ